MELIVSTNFTERSRCNLEFGYWTEEAALVGGASRFLLSLIAASEGVDPDSDSLMPDLAPVDYDDDAFFKYMRDSALDECGGEEST